MSLLLPSKSTVPWPFAEPLQEGPILDLFPKFKVRPLILYAIGEYYLAIDTSARTLGQHNLPIKTSVIKDQTIDWIGLKSTTSISSIQKLVKAPVVIVK
jgi:hypothetical protein